MQEQRPAALPPAVPLVACVLAKHQQEPYLTEEEGFFKKKLCQQNVLLK